jgi:dimethylamine monooxygenase subunit A
MTAILNSTLPALPWQDPRLARLPGLLPVERDEWLLRDEVFALQMAERDRLIATGAPVHGLLEMGVPAAQEAYDLILGKLAQDSTYRFGASTVTRPDGQKVALNKDEPLTCLGRLVQEDLCLMVPDGQGEHVLGGAILCFPASWTLEEKLGRPMTRIHTPVPSYDHNIARRVQRLLDAVQAERPIWRMNHNLYASADLFHPRAEAAPRVDARPQYLRAERQCLVRLPASNSVLFTIHTYVLPLDSLGEDTRASLFAAHSS